MQRDYSENTAKAAIVIGFLALFGLIGWKYRSEVVVAYNNGRMLARTMLAPKPCTAPITFSIGSIDKEFNLSQAEALTDITTAANVWNSAEQQMLFAPKEKGDLQINFIYDYRQKATAQMQSIKTDIKSSALLHDQAKARYDSLQKSYVIKKAALDAEVASFTARQNAYTSRVTYWNSRGGAPSSEYSALQAEQRTLATISTKIKADQSAFNDLVVNLNSSAAEANQLAKDLNLNVTSYNAVGESTGREFDEAEYLSDADGMRINIYQFTDTAKLVRVLTHEFGHALGMDHVTDPNAIMYYLNQGPKDIPTAADLTELARICGNQK